MTIIRERKLISRIFTVLLYFLSFSLPILIPSWHGKLLVILGVTWLLSLKDVNAKGLLKEGIFFISVLLLVLLQLLGILYSINIKSGFAAIESLIPILILPIIIFSSENIMGGKVIKLSLIGFSVGVISLNLASLFFISKDLWDPINLQSNIVLANNHIVKIHPAYVSLYLSFSIFFILDQFFPLQTENRKKLGWVLFALVVLSGYLIWINSRTGILSFCVAFFFYSIYRFRNRARVISLSLLAIFIIIIFSAAFSRERFFAAPKLALFDSHLKESSDPNLYPLIARKQIFECSVELIKSPEIFYGYGTGDFRDVLKECFRQKGYNVLYEKSLDQHNEYFAQLHRHGIIGLGLFLTLLIIPFRYALKYRSPLLAVFIILFAITALFENVFSAQKGVTFFALICPLLMLNARKNYEPESVAES